MLKLLHYINHLTCPDEVSPIHGFNYSLSNNWELQINMEQLQWMFYTSAESQSTDKCFRKTYICGWGKFNRWGIEVGITSISVYWLAWEIHWEKSTEEEIKDNAQCGWVQLISLWSSMFHLCVWDRTLCGDDHHTPKSRRALSAWHV